MAKVTVTHKKAAPVKASERSGIKGNVIMILQDAATGRVEKIVEAHNIVTDAGDQYYAERACKTPAAVVYTFHRGKLGIAASYRQSEGKAVTYGAFTFGGGWTGVQSFDSGYPKTSDTDTDNTGSGADIVTYRRTYSTSQGNYTIKALGIVRFGATTTAAVTLRYLLNYVTLSVAQQVTKTNSQTLKVFVNHTMNGV